MREQIWLNKENNQDNYHQVMILAVEEASKVIEAYYQDKDKNLGIKSINMLKNKKRSLPTK